MTCQGAAETLVEESILQSCENLNTRNLAVSAYNESVSEVEVPAVMEDVVQELVLQSATEVMKDCVKGEAELEAEEASDKYSSAFVDMFIREIASEEVLALVSDDF